MLTANDSDHQRNFAEFLGVDAYLNKPIGIKPLLGQLQRFCPVPNGAFSRSRRNQCPGVISTGA